MREAFCRFTHGDCRERPVCCRGLNRARLAALAGIYAFRDGSAVNHASPKGYKAGEPRRLSDALGALTSAFCTSFTASAALT